MSHTQCAAALKDTTEAGRLDPRDKIVREAYPPQRPLPFLLDEEMLIPQAQCSTPRDDLSTTRSFVLDEAKAIVYGPRQHQYGHPSVNFKRIAEAWAPIFGHEVSIGEVGLSLLQLKIMRAVNQLHKRAGQEEIRDTFVDIAGYSEATMRALFEEAP